MEEEGIDPANVTSDDMLYRGGGALYASARGKVVIGGSLMTDNAGANGGGAIIRTDLCSQGPAKRANGTAAPPTTGPHRCLVLLGPNRVYRNTATAGIGGGLLITNTSLAFTSCGARSVSANSSRGLMPLGDCLERARGGAAADGDSEAEPPPDARLRALGLPYGNAAKDPDTDDIASIVAKLVVACAGTSTNALTQGAACDAGGRGGGVRRVTAPPGSVIQAEVAVQDWQGSNIVSGFDSALLLQARVFSGDGEWRPDITALGNVTSAAGGLARFSGLQLIANPGRYQLRFTPLVLEHHHVAPALLDLDIRQCISGESNTSARTAGGAGGGGLATLTMCERCREGTVSLDPLASGGCAMCEASMHATCKGDAMIPDDGWWQSHPRSPQVHRCLLVDACNHSARAGEMQAWAAAHAAMTVAELAPSFREYTQMQCAKGYQGVLCGECDEGFGRRGQSCIRCIQPSLNSFLYFMALSWIGLLITVSAVFHMKQVGQRREHRMTTGTSFVTAASGDTSRFDAGPRGSGPPPEREEPATAAKSGGSGGSDAFDGGDDVLTHDVSSSFVRNGSLYSAASHGPGPFARPGAQGGGGGRGGNGGPPPAGSFHKAAALQAAAGLQGSSSGSLQSSGSGLQGSGSGSLPLQPGSRRFQKQPSRFGAMFSSDMRADSIAHAQLGVSPSGREPRRGGASARFADPLSVARLSATSSAGGGGGASASGRYDSGLTMRTVSALSADSGRAAAAGGGGGAPPSGGSASDGEVAGSLAGDDGGAQGGAGQTRFWLSNIFKLLITHMQMLGLLRGIRMDWPGGMDKIMGYFDQSSTISFWVVLECSFARAKEGALRPSIIRMIVLLMMPAAGALVALAFWGLCALLRVVRNRVSRRPVASPVTLAYYHPRFVMSIGMVCFYMFPQVSDAVVSILVACTPVDDAANISPASLPLPGTASPGGSAIDALQSVGLYWNLDTRYQCFDGPMRWLMAMGITWAGLFCVGFPVGMALVLWRNKAKLQDTVVDLKYGFFFDSYRLQYYYWESVLLVEKLVLALSVTATQRFGAPSQVMAAQCTFFLSLILQGNCHPYGCRMLDTLQSGSLYALTGTAFALMMPALDSVLAPSIGADPSRSTAVTAAALGLMGLLNLSVVGVFIYAMALEAKRMVVTTLDRDGKGHVTWADVRGFAHAKVPPRIAGLLRPCLGPPPAGGGGGTVTGYPAGGRPGPPEERVPEECEMEAGGGGRCDDDDECDQFGRVKRKRGKGGE
ncbi:MAG: hypothetical protein J3K34DRAFT_523752 [Monoraphidium minutum]|nr:MAG: hypothetical protein J3K34DRAFT_523752 [Monoraphidium minutum]